VSVSSQVNVAIRAAILLRIRIRAWAGVPYRREVNKQGFI